MGEYCNSASFSGSFSQTVSYIDHLTLGTALVDLTKAWILMEFIVKLKDEHIVTIYFCENCNLPVLKDHLSQETTFGLCKLTHQGYASASLTLITILIHHSTVLLICNLDYSHNPLPPPQHTTHPSLKKGYYEWNRVKVIKIFKCFLPKLNEVLHITVYINSHHKVCMVFCSCRRIIA